MSEASVKDYSLLGETARRAVESGLAGAKWYAAQIPRKRMKELMARSDGPALRDAAIWFALIIGLGALGIATWGTWWAVPVFFAYGTLYGGTSDSRWHEWGHGTSFKTTWIADALYQVASFMILRRPTVWRWSHSRHHSDTVIVGRDPEIIQPRPPSFVELGLNVFALRSGVLELRGVLRNAAGRLSPAEASYIPESEWPRVCHEARVWLGIYASVIAIAVGVHSLLPLMLIGLPSFYGAWFTLFTGLTQHIGLAEDVLDHRLNSRTVMMGPVMRYLYFNMNYHVEHHMFPMVPYHRLPALHAEIKDELPYVYPSVWAAYREIIPTLIRQRRDPTYFIRHTLPPAMAEREMALMTAAE